MTCNHVDPVGYVTVTVPGFTRSRVVCNRKACIDAATKYLNRLSRSRSEFIPFHGVATGVDDYGFARIRDTPYDETQGPRCIWICDDGLRCDDPGTETFGPTDGGLPICTDHMPMLLGQAIGQMEAERDEDGRGRPDGIYAASWNLDVLDSIDLAARRAEPATIYFVHREGWIKIGFTTNLRLRLAALAMGGVQMPAGMTFGPVDLLATQDGNRAGEHRLHAHFASARVAGEWFEPTDALLEHIVAIGGSVQAVQCRPHLPAAM